MNTNTKKKNHVVNPPKSRSNRKKNNLNKKSCHVGHADIEVAESLAPIPHGASLPPSDNQSLSSKEIILNDIEQNKAPISLLGYALPGTASPSKSTRNSETLYTTDNPGVFIGTDPNIPTASTSHKTLPALPEKAAQKDCSYESQVLFGQLKNPTAKPALDPSITKMGSTVATLSGMKSTSSLHEDHSHTSKSKFREDAALGIEASESEHNSTLKPASTSTFTNTGSTVSTTSGMQISWTDHEDHPRATNNSEFRVDADAGPKASESKHNSTLELTSTSNLAKKGSTVVTMWEMQSMSTDHHEDQLQSPNSNFRGDAGACTEALESERNSTLKPTLTSTQAEKGFAVPFSSAIQNSNIRGDDGACPEASEQASEEHNSTVNPTITSTQAEMIVTVATTSGILNRSTEHEDNSQESNSKFPQNDDIKKDSSTADAHTHMLLKDATPVSVAPQSLNCRLGASREASECFSDDGKNDASNSTANIEKKTEKQLRRSTRKRRLTQVFEFHSKRKLTLNGQSHDDDDDESHTSKTKLLEEGQDDEMEVGSHKSGDDYDDSNDSDFEDTDSENDSLEEKTKVSTCGAGAAEQTVPTHYPSPIEFTGLRLFARDQRKEFINQINADNPQAKLNLRFVLLGADMGMKPSMKGKKSYINDSLYIIMVVARQLRMSVPELLSWHFMHRPKRNSWRVRLSTFFERGKEKGADVRLCTLQSLLELAVIRVNLLLLGNNRFKITGYKTIAAEDLQKHLSIRVSNWMIIAWTLGWLFQDGNTWLTLPQSEFYCDVLRRGGVFTCSGAIDALDICMRVHHSAPPKKDVIQFWRREHRDKKDVLKLMQQGIEEERSVYVERVRNKVMQSVKNKDSKDEATEYGWRMKLEMIREASMKSKEKNKKKTERSKKIISTQPKKVDDQNTSNDSSSKSAHPSATIVGNTVHLNLNDAFAKEMNMPEEKDSVEDLPEDMSLGEQDKNNNNKSINQHPVGVVTPGSKGAGSQEALTQQQEPVGVITPGVNVPEDAFVVVSANRYTYTDMSLCSYAIHDLQPSNIVMINGRLYGPLPDSESQEDCCFIDSPPLDFSKSPNPIIEHIKQQFQDSACKLVSHEMLEQYSPALHIKEYFQNPGVSSVYEVMAISRLEIYGRVNFHKDTHWMECGPITNKEDLLSSSAKASFRTIPSYKSIDSSHKFFVLRETNPIFVNALRLQNNISYESIVRFVKEHSQNSPSRDGTTTTSNGWRFDFGTSVQASKQIQGTGYWRPIHDFNVKTLEEYDDDKLIPSLASLMDTIQICTDQVYKKTRQHPPMMDVDRDNFFGSMLRQRLGSKESRFETYSIQLKSMSEKHTTKPHKDNHNCSRWPMTVSFSIALEHLESFEVTRLNIIAYNRHKAFSFTDKWRKVQSVVPYIEKYERNWTERFIEKCNEQGFDTDTFVETNCHNINDIYLSEDLGYQMVTQGTTTWMFVQLPACSTRDIWLSAPSHCIRMILSKLIDKVLIFEFYLIALDQNSWFWFWKICHVIIDEMPHIEEKPGKLLQRYIAICKQLKGSLTGGIHPRFRASTPDHLEQLAASPEKLAKETASLKNGLSAANLGLIQDYDSWLNMFVIDSIHGVGPFRSQLFLPICALSGMTTNMGTLAATRAVVCKDRASMELLKTIEVDISDSEQYMREVSKFLGYKYFNHAIIENIFCESIRDRSPWDILFKGQSIFRIEFVEEFVCKVVEKPYGGNCWIDATIAPN